MPCRTLLFHIQQQHMNGSHTYARIISIIIAAHNQHQRLRQTYINILLLTKQLQ